MRKLLRLLVEKNFRVYVGDEFERRTDLMGFIKLLANYSDFFSYTKSEQISYLKELLKDKEQRVDSIITIKIK